MDNLTNVCEATSQSQDLDNLPPTHRKGKKLLAEKKRRARINNCLMQIRHLVCEGQEEKKDTDLDKMEKAEILEKTLEVLTRLRHDGSKSSGITSTRKAMAVRYASGFSSCAEESIRYIQNSRLVPAEVKVQLQNHLRAIARRMENIVHVDNQSFAQRLSASSTSSSSVSLEILPAVGLLTDDSNSSSVVERVQCQLTNDTSEIGSYYSASPRHYSTPVVRKHLSVVTPSSLDQEHKYINYIPEVLMEHNINQNNRSIESCPSHIFGTPMQMKFVSEQFSSDSESVFHHLEMFCPESAQVKRAQHSSMSSESSSLSSICGHMSSVSSPVYLHPSIALPTTPIHPYKTVYSYYDYEPNQTTSSALVQSNQLSSSCSRVSNVVKLPNTSSTVLDLCVKRPDDQQISPETMWRPW